ncbi:Transporter [Candidatus Rhodobacter oscarellae]|uniref:Transporter n=1 Tax=Candidatus Rhodobacter oscarellae TaxID=1675527 RepID=A0A0J9GUH1_9RHOB|nr:DUF502 domain-containing protein [Candidatus Rhodobacter lobularis]KMW57233.1 Transporter [Candidatus Rhodobacter lobularis]
MTAPFDPNEPEVPKPRRAPITGLRNSFLTGLVVIAPIGLTVWLLWTVIGWVDAFVLPFVPGAYMPDALLNRFLGNAPGSEDWIKVNVRGVGVVVFLLFTLFIGWIAKGLIGRSIIAWAQGLFERTPVVRTIYNGLKQIAETVFNQSETSFDKAVLVQYPRTGIWAIAFVSTSAKGEIQSSIPREEQLMSVFLPTTPNPTSGFLLFVPKSDMIELSMSVEDAAKLVISAGLVYPNGTVAPVDLDAIPEKDRERLSA